MGSSLFSRKISFSQVHIYICMYFLHKLLARLQCRAIFCAYISSVRFESIDKLPQLRKKTDVGIIIMAIRIIGGILTGAIDDVGVTVVLMLEVPK